MEAPADNLRSVIDWQKISSDEWVTRIAGTALIPPKNASYDSRMDKFLFGDADAKTTANLVEFNLKNKTAELGYMEERYNTIQREKREFSQYIDDPKVKEQLTEKKATFDRILVEIYGPKSELEDDAAKPVEGTSADGEDVEMAQTTQ